MLDQVTDGRRRPTALALLAAALVGLAAGALTFGMERLDDSPAWFGLWHGLDPWGLAALAAGACFPGRWRAAALAGAVTQVSLVAGYYTIETMSLGMVSEDLPFYLAVGLVAGPVHGVSGMLLRGPRNAVRAAASGVLAAPWLATGSRTFLDGVTDSGTALAVAVGALLIGAVIPFALNAAFGARLVGLTSAGLIVLAFLWMEKVPLG